MSVGDVGMIRASLESGGGEVDAKSFVVGIVVVVVVVTVRCCR